MKLHRLTIIAALLAGLAAAPATASADEALPGATGETVTAVPQTAETLDSCRDPVLSNPLVAFGDTRHYFTAPGGDFGDAGGWVLDGGAFLADGALLIPTGGSAMSPQFCVDLHYPTFRFFYALQAGTDKGVAVDVIYPDVEKSNVRRGKPLRDNNGRWSLSRDVALHPQVAGKQAGWRKVALRFRVPEARDAALWRIDDVLIDPRLRG